MEGAALVRATRAGRSTAPPVRTLCARLSNFSRSSRPGSSPVLASVTKNVSIIMPSARVRISALRMLNPAAVRQPVMLLKRRSRSQVQTVTVL